MHSIWILDADECDAAQDAIHLAGPNAEIIGALGFDAIDVRAVQPTGDDLTRVVSYASKLIGFNSLDLQVGMDFEVYPLGSR